MPRHAEIQCALSANPYRPRVCAPYSYSMSVHGPGFETLYSCAKGAVASIVAVKTSSHAVLGAFVSSEWAVQEGDGYYGDGDCFVFSGAAKDNFSMFRSCGANTFYQLASADSLAVGGGNHCALYLDCEGFGGTTGACETFKSPPLVSGTSASAAAAAGGEIDFQCSNLEVWGFVPAVSNPLARSRETEMVASLVQRPQPPDFGTV